MGENQEKLEKEADEALTKNPKDLGANRAKAKLCYLRNQMQKAYKYAMKGIPVGENGKPEVVRDDYGKVDLSFAGLLSTFYWDEGKFDEAIRCREQYLEELEPGERKVNEMIFSQKLQKWKEEKIEMDKIEKDLLKYDQIKDENEKKKEKKKEKNRKKKEKRKKKIGKSLSEAKEEKESNTDVDEDERNNEDEDERKLDTKNEDEDQSKTESEDQSKDERLADQDKHHEFRTITYSVFIKKEKDIFVGSMGSENSDMEDRSFILASDLQLKHFRELQMLGSSFAGILYVERRIYDSDQKAYLVVERVEPIDSFFEKLMNSFTDLDKPKWWNLIEKVFKEYFRDIVESLQFLYSEQRVCGNLSFGLYVTPYGRVKILPSMESKQTPLKDFKDLIGKMKHIIGLPFEVFDVANDPEFNLPASLITLLTSFNCTTANLVPWVIKSPFFWTTKEKFKFLEGVAQVIRSDHWIRQKLEWVMVFCATFQRDWCDELNGAYKEIWRKGDPNLPVAQSIPEGCFQVRPYKSNSCLYRYLCAAKKHVNEKDYSTYRSGEKYSDERIARDIEWFFPLVYTDSHQAIHDVLSDFPEFMEHFMDIVF